MSSLLFSLVIGSKENSIRNKLISMHRLFTEGYFVNDMYNHDCSGHPAVLFSCFIYGFIVIYENQNLKKRADASTNVVRMLNERNVCNNYMKCIFIQKVQENTHH